MKLAARCTPTASKRSGLVQARFPGHLPLHEPQAPARLRQGVRRPSSQPQDRPLQHIACIVEGMEGKWLTYWSGRKGHDLSPQSGPQLRGEREAGLCLRGRGLRRPSPATAVCEGQTRLWPVGQPASPGGLAAGGPVLKGRGPAAGGQTPLGPLSATGLCQAYYRRRSCRRGSR